MTFSGRTVQTNAEARHLVDEMKRVAGVEALVRVHTYQEAQQLPDIADSPQYEYETKTYFEVVAGRPQDEFAIWIYCRLWMTFQRPPGELTLLAPYGRQSVLRDVLVGRSIEMGRWTPPTARQLRWYASMAGLDAQQTSWAVEEGRRMFRAHHAGEAKHAVYLAVACLALGAYAYLEGRAGWRVFGACVALAGVAFTLFAAIRVLRR